MKILIADDDLGYRFPIKAMFEDQGYEVEEARNEQEVLNIAPQTDVWIIDVRLPNAREGINAVSRLVQQEKNPTNPVIFTSVDTEDDAENELKQLRDGAIEFEWFEKPFELETLLRTVQRFQQGTSQ